MTNKLDPTVAKESPALFWLTEFNGVNLHDDRRAIGDQECAWLENFIPLGAANARAMYDASIPLYTTSGGLSIIYQFPFNIGTIFYHALFLSDGSAVQVRVDTGGVVSMGGAGTFSFPACAQWGASGILIVTASGYYAWDGALYIPGAFAPAWLSGNPANIVTTGDTQSNATIINVASVAGLVIGMNIYDADNDIPQISHILITAFDGSAKTITLSSPAVGSHAGDTLTANWMMPLGLVGTAIEIYAQRVWVFNGAQFSFSAPSNGATFATSDGGGTFKTKDGFLKKSYVNAKQANGFLYTFGDASINVISNVVTAGSPTVTTFSNQNVDPQTGLGWRDSLVAFGRALCFANPNGVYVLYGGSAQKISDKIDALFEKLDTSTVTPSMFVTSIFGLRCLGIVMHTLDPTTNTNRTLIALWTGTKWFIASQAYTTTFAATMEQFASPQGWGNDGTNLYQLFTTPSTSLAKKVVSKLWQGNSILTFKTARAVYTETDDISKSGIVVNGTIDSDTNSPTAFSISQFLFWTNAVGGLIIFTNNLGQPLQFLTNVQGLNGSSCDQSGKRLGITMISNTASFDLLGLGLTYGEETYYGP